MDDIYQQIKLAAYENEMENIAFGDFLKAVQSAGQSFTHTGMLKV